MRETRFSIGKTSVVLYGGDGDKCWLFVHGKGGCKEEAQPFAELAVPAGAQVLSVDLPEHGETLSWRYYLYAKEHPITAWASPASILCAERDNLTPQDEFRAFSDKFGCEMTVVSDAEHWFHTAEQLSILKNWEKRMLP